MKRFRQISKFPNYYISPKGFIWSAKSHKYIQPCIGHGYLQINLCRNNKVYCRRVHRLLLETFISLCPEGMQACHNNGNKLDNRLNNLRWDTPKNNIMDAMKQGTHSSLLKSKLTEQDVRYIRFIHTMIGCRQKEIAKIYNIKQNTVSQIVNRKRWKHI